jgi:outer membrane receptor for ferrienterochelin and colicins
MNKRKSFSLFPSVTAIPVHSTFLRMLCLLSCFVALWVRASETETNQNSPDLTSLSLEALMNIEIPTVIGASKFEQKATEAPASVTVITSDEIKRYGYRTLADVLQSVQGFYVSYDRNYSFLGSRGMNLGDFNSRILLLVNGHRLNNNLTDGAAIGTDFILDVDLIDHVEIIRGPSAVLYGNNAFFGVINVITRQGKQVDGAEVSAEYAQFDSYKGRVTFGKSFTNGFQFLLSGSWYDSAGPDRLFYHEYNTPAQNNGIAQNLDGDSSKSLFGSFRFGDFTLEGGFITRNKENPTAQYFSTTFNDPRLQTTDDRSYTSLKYAHSFPEIVDVTAQVYYDRYDFKIGYPQTAYDATGTNVIFRGFATEKDAGEWWGTEVQFNKRLWERHIITLGAEFRDDFRQERQSSGQMPVEQTRLSYGIYLQGDFMLLTNLHFNAGVRYDQYGDFDPAVNPRLALIYNPWKTATLKAIYGTAFRAPNFLELALSPPGQLKPEKITSYELVYEQEIVRHLHSSISGFYNQMNGLIAFENGQFVNFDANTRGLELALEGNWNNGIRSRLSYSLQRTDAGSEQTLPDSPEHLIKMNVSVPVYKQKVFAGLEFQYTSTRQTLFTDSSGATLRGMDAGGFETVNFTIFSHDLVKNLEFSGGVYNLFDARYSDPSSRFHLQDTIEQDGRSFRLKLTYRF